MDPKISKILFLSLLVFFSTHVLCALEPEEVTEFVFQTLLLGRFTDDHPTPLFYQQDEEFLPASFSLLSLGLKHTFRGTGLFRFYKKVETPDGVVMQPVAEIDLSQEKGEHLFLIVFPAPEGKLKLRAVQVGANRVKPSELLLLNYSDEPLALSVSGKDIVQILPGQTNKIPYEIEEGKFSFALKVAAKNEDGWRVVHSRMVTQVERLPLFVIAFKDAAETEQWQLRFLKGPSPD